VEGQQRKGKTFVFQVSFKKEEGKRAIRTRRNEGHQGRKEHLSIGGKTLTIRIVRGGKGEGHVSHHLDAEEEERWSDKEGGRNGFIGRGEGERTPASSLREGRTQSRSPSRQKTPAISYPGAFPKGGRKK